MKQIVQVIIICTFIFSCKEKTKYLPRNISKVEIKTHSLDSSLSIRALDINKEDKVFFLTSNGFGGVIYNSEYDKETNVIYPIPMAHDSVKNNFRAVSSTRKNGFALTIGTPARLYKMKNDEKVIVYEETHPKAFYDSMDFWNDQEGIAIGDPTDDCLSIIITRDGGNTWNKLLCDDLPKAKEGEAAFAASDTNIAIVNDHTWVATGGKASRVLYSPDKGETWKVFETPIIQGKETTGMYSIDFYNEKIGFAIGGDYTQPDTNSVNKIRTTNGGKTWELVAQNQNPGYRSCVQFVPNGKGKELVALGFNGIDYSNDFGASWKHLSDEGFYTIRFLNDSIAYAAGKGRISKLMFK